ncbi:kinesin-like protein KIN-13A [Iris pallida]|uniref:Kinesin-like protein KIN-13A n=1 Tax=Iris pallida TaxID=29817 RepID=A0AAX6GG89_IRIPA|nr:kinesin-like protein KIN-13A [Iris pallida]
MVKVAVRHKQCNLYLSKRQRTLCGCCVSQSIAMRSLNCGLVILRSMEGNSLIFLVIRRRTSWTIS